MYRKISSNEIDCYENSNLNDCKIVPHDTMTLLFDCVKNIEELSILRQNLVTLEAAKQIINSRIVFSKKYNSKTSGNIKKTDGKKPQKRKNVDSDNESNISQLARIKEMTNEHLEYTGNEIVSFLKRVKEFVLSALFETNQVKQNTEATICGNEQKIVYAFEDRKRTISTKYTVKMKNLKSFIRNAHDILKRLDLIIADLPNICHESLIYDNTALVEKFDEEYEKLINNHEIRRETPLHKTGFGSFNALIKSLDNTEYLKITDDILKMITAAEKAIRPLIDWPDKPHAETQIAQIYQIAVSIWKLGILIYKTRKQIVSLAYKVACMGINDNRFIR